MSHSPRTGFMVFHSNRMEALRDLLVAQILRDPLPPLAAETVRVQSTGMKHWLTVSLAKDDALGICAATRMVLPSAQLWQLYRCVLGADRLPMHMPLDKAPLTWRILRRLPHWLSDPRFAPLAHYLGDDSSGIRAYQLAQQLADVLDGYQNYRSDWLSQWAQGRDTLDRGQPLPPSQTWQAPLWRDLLADVEQQADGGFQARADVHQAFLKALRQRPPGSIAGLPPRLMVFGITALPMQTMEALVALGRHLPVLMFVHNPCREHWGHVSEDMTGGGHPLLAAWGKQGRDYLHAIDQFEAVDEYSPEYERVSVFIDPLKDAADMQLPAGVLHQLQADIYNLHMPQAKERTRQLEDDTLVCVQAHSAQREVEVLHDKLLAWLNADPQLQPSDIMVMVPDMALFAPHIHAVFGRYQGAGNGHSGLDLPYSVTDSTPRSHPLVQAVDSLLQLPQLRLSLRDWLGWFQVAAVRQRYGLSQTDVTQLHDWLAAAGVRWGLDETHRQPWGIDPALPDADQNSWGFGLRRLLLGYAFGPQALDPLWQHTVAQPGVGGLDAAVIGGLLQWLDDMNRSLHTLRTDRTPGDWVAQMQALVERFFKAEDDADQRVLDQLLAPLQDWLADCQLAGFDQPLSLGVLRSHWMAQLDAIGLQRRFADGGVQFATLMPMRAIPFKVVCLLGMNDSAYPRSPTPRDFDLISQPGHARAGDRARREDDRYLFLEAVLSARQRLYISWQGRRASDHAPLPPSVLVAQLLDHLNHIHQQPDKKTKVFSAALQPLQAFSRAYFKAGSGFATYAADWALAARPAVATGADTAMGLPPPTVLDHACLLTLLRQPLEVFFKHHLQVQLDSPQEEDEENEPFGLNGLNAYQLKQRVLVSEQPEALLQQLKWQGELAMAAGGQAQQAQLFELQQQVWAQCRPWQQDADVDLPLQLLALQAHGASLALNWGGDPLRWRLHPDGSVLQIDVRAGKLKQDKRIRLHTLPGLWLGHLTANAAGSSTTSVLSGEDGVLCLQPLSQPQALAVLQDLIAFYQQAWAQPLPLALKTASAYLTERAHAAQSKHPQFQEQRGLSAARLAFTGRRDVPGECQTSAYVQRAYPRFEDLDIQRFTQLADQLYGPMLRACQTDDAMSEQESA